MVSPEDIREFSSTSYTTLGIQYSRGFSTPSTVMEVKLVINESWQTKHPLFKTNPSEFVLIIWFMEILKPSVHLFFLLQVWAKEKRHPWLECADVYMASCILSICQTTSNKSSWNYTSFRKPLMPSKCGDGMTFRFSCTCFNDNQTLMHSVAYV